MDERLGTGLSRSAHDGFDLPYASRQECPRTLTWGSGEGFQGEAYASRRKPWRSLLGRSSVTCACGAEGNWHTYLSQKEVLEGSTPSLRTVAVAQWVEHRVVIAAVASSNLVSHPRRLDKVRKHA